MLLRNGTTPSTCVCHTYWCVNEETKVDLERDNLVIAEVEFSKIQDSLGRESAERTDRRVQFV